MLLLIALKNREYFEMNLHDNNKGLLSWPSILILIFILVWKYGKYNYNKINSKLNYSSSIVRIALGQLD